RAQTKITHRCSTARQRLGPPARPQFFFIQKSLSAARRGFFFIGAVFLSAAVLLPVRVAPFHTGAGVISAQRASYCSAPPLRPSFSVRFPLYWFSIKKECKKNSEKKIKKTKKCKKK
ncbi:MAG: hypothetical protein ACI3XG_10180, partial [Faecousia sp.]